MAKKILNNIAYENRLRDAYEKYAPKNQSFDEFKSMFETEQEFDSQLATWQSFEPQMVNMGQYAQFPDNKFMPSPYSTYDPELAKKLKDVDAKYADEIADITKQIDALKEQIRPYEDARTSKIRDQKWDLENIAKERLGHRPSEEDWDLEILQDLKQQHDELSDKRWNPKDSDYDPTELELLTERDRLENLKQGYEVARDYEKSKLINATIPQDVADKVAETRRQELINIIADDDELFAQVQNFSNLSIQEKQTFLQTVHDKLDEATHVSGFRVIVYEDPKSSIVANAARQYNNKPLGKDLDIEEVLETIAHEQSHLIDSDVADLGMLGAQKAKEHIKKANMDTQWKSKWGWNKMAPKEERLKFAETDAVYRADPSEYSSWQVGGDRPEHMMQQIIDKRNAKMQPKSKQDKFNTATNRVQTMVDKIKATFAKRVNKQSSQNE